MLLAVDIGNTNVTLGMFEGEQLRATWRMATDINQMGDEYAATMLTLLAQQGMKVSDIKEAAMCSVVPPVVAVVPPEPGTGARLRGAAVPEFFTLEERRVFLFFLLFRGGFGLLRRFGSLCGGSGFFRRLRLFLFRLRLFRFFCGFCFCWILRRGCLRIFILIHFRYPLNSIFYFRVCGRSEKQKSRRCSKRKPRSKC